MRRAHRGAMDKPAELLNVEPLEQAAPYGDVALGVECAWPGIDFDLLPVEHPAS